MTRQNGCTLSPNLVQLIADQWLDVLPELIRIAVKQTTQAERSQ